MSISYAIFPLLVYLAVIIVTFFILRSFVLWYWRVNHSIYFLEWQKNLLETHKAQNKRIIYLLEKIAGEEHQTEETQDIQTKPVETSGKTSAELVNNSICPHCGAKNMPQNYTCSSCFKVLRNIGTTP